MTPEQQQDFYQSLGSRIRQAREDRGFTQEGLAHRLDLTRTSITNIEKGRQKLLLHTFAKLVDVLEVDPERLLPSTDPPSSPHNTLPNLDELLKDHSEQEQAWIKAALSSVDAEVERQEDA